MSASIDDHLDLMRRVGELEKTVKKQTDIIEILLKGFNNHSHFKDDLKNDTYLLIKEAYKP